MKNLISNKAFLMVLAVFMAGIIFSNNNVMAGSSCQVSIIGSHDEGEVDGYGSYFDFQKATNHILYYDYSHPETAMVDSTVPGCQTFKDITSVHASPKDPTFLDPGLDWAMNRSCTTISGCAGLDNGGILTAKDRMVLVIYNTTQPAPYKSRLLVDSVAFDPKRDRFNFDASAGYSVIHQMLELDAPAILSHTSDGETTDVTLSIQEPSFDVTGVNGGLYGDDINISSRLVAGYKVVATVNDWAPSNGLIGEGNWDFPIDDDDRYIPSSGSPRGASVTSFEITIKAAEGQFYLAYAPIFNYANGCAAATCTVEELKHLDALGDVLNNSLTSRIAGEAAFVPESIPMPVPVPPVSDKAQVTITSLQMNGGGEIEVQWQADAAQEEVAGFYTYVSKDGESWAPADRELIAYKGADMTYSQTFISESTPFVKVELIDARSNKMIAYDVAGVANYKPGKGSSEKLSGPIAKVRITGMRHVGQQVQVSWQAMPDSQAAGFYTYLSIDTKNWTLATGKLIPISASVSGYSEMVTPGKNRFVKVVMIDPKSNVLAFAVAEFNASPTGTSKAISDLKTIPDSQWPRPLPVPKVNITEVRSAGKQLQVLWQAVTTRQAVGFIVFLSYDGKTWTPATGKVIPVSTTLSQYSEIFSPGKSLLVKVAMIDLNKKVLAYDVAKFGKGMTAEDGQFSVPLPKTILDSQWPRPLPLPTVNITEVRAAGKQLQVLWQAGTTTQTLGFIVYLSYDGKTWTPATGKVIPVSTTLSQYSEIFSPGKSLLVKVAMIDLNKKVLAYDVAKFGKGMTAEDGQFTLPPSVKITGVKTLGQEIQILWTAQLDRKTAGFYTYTSLNGKEWNLATGNLISPAASVGFQYSEIIKPGNYHFVKVTMVDAKRNILAFAIAQVNTPTLAD